MDVCHPEPGAEEVETIVSATATLAGIERIPGNQVIDVVPVAPFSDLTSGALQQLAIYND